MLPTIRVRHLKLVDIEVFLPIPTLVLWFISYLPLTPQSFVAFIFVSIVPNRISWEREGEMDRETERQREREEKVGSSISSHNRKLYQTSIEQSPVPPPFWSLRATQQPLTGQYWLTYFVRGSITTAAQLTSCLTDLDSTKRVKLLTIS